ncbi:hypothetical protein V8D89_006064 [Ganoderma adspersum]
MSADLSLRPHTRSDRPIPYTYACPQRPVVATVRPLLHRLPAAAPPTQQSIPEVWSTPNAGYQPSPHDPALPVHRAEEHLRVSTRWRVASTARETPSHLPHQALHTTSTLSAESSVVPPLLLSFPLTTSSRSPCSTVTLARLSRRRLSFTPQVLERPAVESSSTCHFSLNTAFLIALHQTTEQEDASVPHSDGTSQQQPAKPRVAFLTKLYVYVHQIRLVHALSKLHFSKDLEKYHIAEIWSNPPLLPLPFASSRGLEFSSVFHCHFAATTFFPTFLTKLYTILERPENHHMIHQYLGEPIALFRLLQNLELFFGRKMYGDEGGHSQWLALARYFPQHPPFLTIHAGTGHPASHSESSPEPALATCSRAAGGGVPGPCSVLGLDVPAASFRPKFTVVSRAPGPDSVSPLCGRPVLLGLAPKSESVGRRKATFRRYSRYIRRVERPCLVELVSLGFPDSY